MIDYLYSIDKAIFYFINNTLSNPIFDKFFPFITYIPNWFIAYIILWFIILLKGSNRGKIAAFLVILLIATSDQMSSSILKNLFERIRPCNIIENVNILINCPKSYSMPSSHAVNNFAVAIYFSYLYPKLKWVLIITASLIALSRVYVGVHYPSDIIIGALIGSVIGFLFSIITKKIEILLNTKKS